MEDEKIIYSREVKDILSTPPKLIFRSGNVLLVIVFCVFLFLSFIVRIPYKVTANSKIIIEPNENLYIPYNAIIDSLLIDDRSKVNIGDTLMVVKKNNHSEEREVVKSNIKGTVFFTSRWIKNNRIKKDDLLFTIVGETDKSYKCILKVAEIDFYKLKPKQKVIVKPTGFKKREHGILEGAIQKKYTIPDNNNLYTVIVDLGADKLMTTNQKELPIENSISVIAEVIVENNRLIDIILP